MALVGLVTPPALADPVARSTAELFDIAARLRPGDTFRLAEGLTAHADPDLPALSALRGDTAVALVGFTDFRQGAPADVDYDARIPLQYRDARGFVLETGPRRPAHPMWPQGEARIDSVATPAVMPVDHRREGGRLVPTGLRIAEDGASEGEPALRLNAIAHNAIPYDGHIIWLAEYARADGSTVTLWEERDDTRARNPALPHRAAVDATPVATHLLRFATLMVAAHDAMPRQPIAQTLDPRRWPLQPKRARHALAIDARAHSWDDAMERIASLPGDGSITGRPAGADYVIELPPDIMGSRPLGVPRAARERLARLRDNRVFLVGTPGRTILPGLDLWGVEGLDIGWVTVTPVLPDAQPDRRLVEIEGGHVRFFGCVIDGFDGSMHGMESRGGIVEFYDGYIGNVGNGVGVSHAAPADPVATPRIIVARSLIDATNDGISKYGSGSLRIESNYFLGRGGAWNRGGFLHADLLGQFSDENPGHTDHRLAIYHNILDAGPNAHHPLALRSAPNLTMVQGGRFHAVDIVGNILAQPVEGGGFQRLDRPRVTAQTAATRDDWFGYYHIGQNMLLIRPDEIRPPFAYPLIDWRGFGGARAADAWSASDNLVSVLPPARRRTAAQAAFSRTLSLLPEEYEALPGRAGATTDFASFPMVAGRWMTGYRLDWSRTRHADTSREGYLSPADVNLRAGAQLRRRGTGADRGLPFFDDYMTRFLDLPSDFRIHLGWTDVDGAARPGSGYGADWFGGWRPPAFRLDAVYEDPWTPMPGSDRVEDRMLVISTWLETLGEGTLREERDAAFPSKLSRLRVERRGDAYFPVFEQTDAQGRLAYRARSAAPLAPGPLLVGISTAFRTLFIERFQSREIARRLAYDHFERPGGAPPLALVLQAQPTPPFDAPPPPDDAVEREFLWLDTDAAPVALRRWSGAGWVAPEGDLARLMSVAVLEPVREALFLRDGVDTDPRSLERLPPGEAPDFRRVWLLARSLADTSLRQLGGIGRRLAVSPGIVAPGYGRGAPQRMLADTLLVALDDPRYPVGGRAFVWTGSTWTPTRGDAFDHEDARTAMGEVAAYFRSGGRASVLAGDWIWPNRDVAPSPTTPAPADDGVRDQPLARGMLRLGAATDDPYRGTVRWYEERRLRAVHRINDVAGPVEVPISGLYHRFAREPRNVATGERDHPLLPGRDDPRHGGFVWEIAPAPRR